MTVGGFAVKPMTAQLMSTPTEPYSCGWLLPARLAPASPIIATFTSFQSISFMWPVYFALTELTADDEARIGELVKKAAS